MAATNTGSREVLKIQTKEVSHEWRIDDFTTSLPYMEDIVESETFPGEDLPQWNLQLEPRGIPARGRKFGVFLMLKKAERGENSIVVDFNIQFLDDNGTQMHIGTGESGRKLDEGVGRGFFLGNDSNEPIPLSASGKLIIRVTIFIRKLVKSVNFLPEIEIPKSSAHQDWMKLLKTAEFSDFIVESADGQEFPVHKAILSARNPHFFAGVIKTEMKEAGDNRVKLPFEEEIVASLLEYLYSDEVVNLTSTAARLYPVAHQYQLDRLVRICAENLCQNLSIANVFISLRIAKLYEDAKLQSACEKFMNGRQSDVVQMVSAAAFNEDSDPKSDGS